MEVSVKFTEQEIVLICDALRLGAIHYSDVSNSFERQKMNNLSQKIQLLGALTK